MDEDLSNPSETHMVDDIFAQINEYQRDPTSQGEQNVEKKYANLDPSTAPMAGSGINGKDNMKDSEDEPLTRSPTPSTSLHIPSIDVVFGGNLSTDEYTLDGILLSNPTSPPTSPLRLPSPLPFSSPSSIHSPRTPISPRSLTHLPPSPTPPPKFPTLTPKSPTPPPKSPTPPSKSPTPPPKSLTPPPNAPTPPPKSPTPSPISSTTQPFSPFPKPLRQSSQKSSLITWQISLSSRLIPFLQLNLLLLPHNLRLLPSLPLICFPPPDHPLYKLSLIFQCN